MIELLLCCVKGRIFLNSDGMKHIVLIFHPCVFVHLKKVLLSRNYVRYLLLHNTALQLLTGLLSPFVWVRLTGPSAGLWLRAGLGAGFRLKVLQGRVPFPRLSSQLTVSWRPPLLCGLPQPGSSLHQSQGESLRTRWKPPSYVASSQA